jgi:hypothetical protein
MRLLFLWTQLYIRNHWLRAFYKPINKTGCDSYFSTISSKSYISFICVCICMRERFNGTWSDVFVYVFSHRLSIAGLLILLRVYGEIHAPNTTIHYTSYKLIISFHSPTSFWTSQWARSSRGIRSHIFWNSYKIMFTLFRTLYMYIFQQLRVSNAFMLGFHRPWTMST